MGEFFGFKFGDDGLGGECDINNQDGIMSANCKRTRELKDGTKVLEGQEFNAIADPNNGCEVAFTGHLAMKDYDGFKWADPLARRLKKGCNRTSKKGLLPQQKSQ